ncbi:hypothetical protein [Lentzea sp.]|uniref:hypothetical protein n=1 Tax=Lentzea sp. TaxID=56099 RepID=UPI002ED1D096
MNAVAHARDVDRARAADLARAGDHASAQRILEGLGRDPSTLDLLARVHAQRGDLAAARAVWADVLSQNPEHASALAGTRLIADITGGRRRARPLPIALIGGSLVVVTVAAALLLQHERPPVAPEPPPVTAQPTAQPVTTTAATPALMVLLASPDVRLEAVGAGVRVVFRQGMFLPDSTSLSLQGLQQLERWGPLLRGKEVRVTVVGHGVAVPGGPATGGSTTALARAAAAVEVLAAVGGQPTTAFLLRSAEQSDLPHADAALNRTVTLVVDPL